jgi:hypothetical protein
MQLSFCQSLGHCDRHLCGACVDLNHRRSLRQVA